MNFSCNSSSTFCYNKILIIRFLALSVARFVGEGGGGSLWRALKLGRKTTLDFFEKSRISVTFFYFLSLLYFNEITAYAYVAPSNRSMGQSPQKASIISCQTLYIYAVKTFYFKIWAKKLFLCIAHCKSVHCKLQKQYLTLFLINN